jgi:uncharacterized membrane protein AbrB (regulator of aidB expression)
MRNVARLIILLGIILLALAAYDLVRGTATATPPGAGNTMIAKKAEHPQDFQRIMAYQWLRGSIIVYTGLFLLRRCRRAEQMDPFFPEFAGKTEVDELERTLDEEQRKR